MMSTQLAVATIISFVALMAAVFRAPRWVFGLVAAILFLIQAFILVISFDNAARTVNEAAIATRTLSVEYADGVSATKAAMLPYRLPILITSAGMLVLILGNKPKK